MMMATDSSHTPPSRLDAATVEVVREALRSYLADGADPAALQRALRRMSTEAHDKSMQAEHLLVLLKDVWSSLPEVRGMTDTTEQIRLLQRVVTMCIKEYYS
jgi:hypothetical protein